MECEYLRKVAFKLNKVLIFSLGVSVVPVYYLVVNKNWADKLLYFQRIFDLLKDVEGDVIECGVASGRSLTILATLVKNSGINRHIWGFDSWEGLPKPTNEDLVSLESIAKRGRFKNSSPERVHTTLWAYGFSNSEIQDMVTLVKGWFSETIPKYRGSRIALLHLDVDLYDSYKDCLHYLWPRVSVNGIVAFDEYHLPNKWPGAKRAVDEFFSQLVPGSARLQRDTVSGLYYAVKTA
jgi:hypothetical protein